MSEYDQGCAAEVQKIYDLLRKLDAKKDGKIDPQALKTEADLILQERINDVFTRLDTNKDGKISREEARGLIKADFDKIDTNKDGFIDRDELLKAARARQQQAADSKATDPKPTEKEKK
jgi:Ca2+-binding EF-hand superfamily protein